MRYLLAARAALLSVDVFGVGFVWGCVGILAPFISSFIVTCTRGCFVAFTLVLQKYLLHVNVQNSRHDPVWRFGALISRSPSCGVLNISKTVI